MSDDIQYTPNAETERHTDVVVNRKISCWIPQHTFTVDIAGTILAPALDLIPGRRCICGYLVIIDHPGRALYANAMIAVPIDSAEATKFAHDHPELKKW